MDPNKSDEHFLRIPNENLLLEKNKEVCKKITTFFQQRVSYYDLFQVK